MPGVWNVREYFDLSAEEYDRRSSTSLWNWQRRRELKAVDELLGHVEGLEVLDLGCGVGFYTRHCLRQGADRVMAVDFSPSMVEQLPKERVDGVVADASEFSAGKTFPKIVCAGLIEFVADPIGVLTNARKMAAPTGTMVCLVPPDNLAGRLYRLYHRRHGIAISLFSRQAFERSAHEAGWEIGKSEFVFPYSMAYQLHVAKAL